MNLEIVKQQIAGMEKQLADRQADLDVHLGGKCRCLKYSQYRCDGHQRAILNVMNGIKSQIKQLKQTKIRLEAKSLDGGKSCSTTDSNTKAKTRSSSKTGKNTKAK
jgi:hypothetical protein